MDRGVRVWVVTLSFPSIYVDGFDRGPESLPLGAAVGEYTCYTYGPDRIELIRIKQDLRFQRGGSWFTSEPVSGDGVNDCFDDCGGLISEDVTGSGGTCRSVVGARSAGLLAADVVQKGSCSYYGEVGVFGLGDAFC